MRIMQIRTMVLLTVIVILAVSAMLPSQYMENQLSAQNSPSRTNSTQSSVRHNSPQEILPIRQIPNPKLENRTHSLFPNSHEVNVQAGYSSEPAPMGIADYGVSSSGAYEYASNSSLGVIVINSLSTSCPSCSGYTSSMSFQLNVNLQFIAGGHTYVYWIQDVAQVDTSLRYIDFIDNVWNLSSSPSNMTSNGISGSGAVALSGTTGFYYALASSSDPGNDVYLTYPSTVEFEVNSSLNTSGKPTVAFAYNDGLGWVTYDTVTFTAVTSLTSLSGFVVDGFQYDPAGLFYDSELVMGGPGGGTQTNDTQSNVQLMLEYWNGHNYQMITNAYNYGSDTAEGMSNVTDGTYYFTNNGTLFVDVQAGAGSLANSYDQSQIGVVSISSTLASGTLTWGNASMASPGPADVSFVDNEVNVTIYPGLWLMHVYASSVLYGSDDVSLTAGGDLKLSMTTSTVSCLVSAVVNGSGTKCTASVLGSSPTGTVTWSQTSSNGGLVSFTTSTCTLSSGSCSVNLTGTSPGKIDISVTYGGDTSNWVSSGSYNLTVSELSGIVDTIDYPIYNGLNSSATRTITVTNPAGNSGLSSLTITIPAGATSSTPTGSCPSDSGVPGGCSVTVFGSGPWAIVYSTTSGALVPAGSTIKITVTIRTEISVAVSGVADMYSFSISATDTNGRGVVLSSMTVYETATVTLSVTNPSTTTHSVLQPFNVGIDATNGSSTLVSGLPLEVSNSSDVFLSPEYFTSTSSATEIQVNGTVAGQVHLTFAWEGSLDSDSSGAVIASVVSETFTITTSFTISQTYGIAGATLSVDGSGFAGSSIITIKYGGNPVSTAPSSCVTNSSGYFSCNIVVPAASSASVNVTSVVIQATDGSSNSASVEFNQVTYPPLDTLFSVYGSRPDLQSAFPNVVNGSTSSLYSLTNWAANTVNDQTGDSSYSTLYPYGYYYDLMSVYSARGDLQSAFPNAFTSSTSFEGLVSWAGGVVTDAYLDGSYASLLPYGYWYALMSTYNARSDLQSALPNVYTSTSSFAKLVSWAQGVVSDQYADSSYYQLEGFGYWYNLMGLYNSRPDLQSAFPNAYSSRAGFTSLVNWAGGVVTKHWVDSSFSTLNLTGYWYDLMSVYNSRADLQIAIPNAYTSHSSFSSLVEWAGSVVIIGTDSSYSTLLPYSYWYNLMGIYSSRSDLQNALPDVYSSMTQFTRLVSWAGGVVTQQTTDSSYNSLKITGYWYDLMAIYNSRADLQSALPDAYSSSSSYSNLLIWAKNVVTNGPSYDSSYPLLNYYASYYEAS